jgi:hypothetical protein
MAAAFQTLKAKLAVRHEALDMQARAALRPVRHTVKVTPL